MESHPKKILIIGGNGYVGSTLARAFASEYEVVCTYQSSFTPIKGATFMRTRNLDDKDIGKNLILGLDPQIVIYCGGSNDLQKTEDDRHAREMNIAHSTVATNLIPAVDTIKAKFIYISSDYIFSGIHGNFAEDDSTVPQTLLGKAKLGAENFIRGRSLNHLIFRCAPLIGRGNLDHPSWIDQLRESLVLGKKLELVSRTFQNPVHISFLVAAIREALIQEQKNKTFHIGGLSKVSPFEFAQIFAHFLKLDPELITAMDAEAHGVPNEYALNFTHTLNMLKLTPLHLEESLALTK